MTTSSATTSSRLWSWCSQLVSSSRNHDDNRGMEPAQLRIAFPKFNQNYVYNEKEFDTVISEVHPFHQKITEEEKKKYREKYLTYYESFGKQVNRIAWFGHCLLFDSFVGEGELTTRHDILYGFINEIAKRIPKIQHREVAYALRDSEDMFISVYELVEMPSVKGLGEVLNQLFQRYPAPKELIPRCGATMIRDYVRKILVHFPETWKWVFAKSNTTPKCLVSKKPFVRVVDLKDGFGKIVFVDEVRMVLEKLEKKKKAEDREHHGGHHFWFFKADYLDYALGLFEYTLNDVQIVYDVLPEQQKKGLFQPIVGPTTDNVMSAENILFRMILIHAKEKNEQRRLDLIAAYHNYLTTGYPLPYFATFILTNGVAYGEKPITDFTFSDMIRSGTPTKKHSKSAKPSDPEPRTRIVTGEKYMELQKGFDKLYDEAAINAITLLWRYPEFALLFHEQGRCTDEFCFAEKYEIDVPYGPCGIPVESMLKRIEFALKQDIRNTGQRQAFLRKIRDEFRMNPHAIKAMQEKEKEEEEGDDNGSSARKANKKERRDSGNSTSSSNQDKVHPEGTEANGKTAQPSNSKLKIRMPKVSESCKNHRTSNPDPLSNIHYFYENLLQVSDEGSQLSLEKLTKLFNQEKARGEVDRKTIENQRAEMKSLKQQMEAMGRSFKEEKDQLTGTIKRMTAEKGRLEDELVAIRTKRAMENPEGAQAEIRKLQAKVKKQDEETALKLDEKDFEIMDLKKEIEKLREEKSILQSQNDAFVAASIQDSKENETIEDVKMTNVAKFEEAELYFKAHAQRVEQEFETLKSLNREGESLREELKEVKEDFKVLQSVSTPCCKAGINRIAAIRDNLKKAEQDEERYASAVKQLDYYQEKEEDSFKWNLFEDAREHLKRAVEAKHIYQLRLKDHIKLIGDNLSTYFTLYDTHVDYVKPYPDPLMPAVVERMRQLDRIMAHPEEKCSQEMSPIQPVAPQPWVPRPFPPPKKNKSYARQNNRQSAHFNSKSKY